MATLERPIVPPEPPDKFSIIPIHASDRASFKKCRRKWNWSSPMRMNLVPKAEEHGIIFPLWFGSGIHWALRHYYDPILKRDPVETFKTWWELQLNGGIITEDWLEVTYDRKPVETAPGYYKVRGLSDILPQPDLEQFEEHRDLGTGMLKFYRSYAEEHDNFEVIAAEHTFSVPVYDFRNDCELRLTDPRDGQEKLVHLRGTQDAIIRDRETGKYGILEHKTAAKIDEDYFLKLDKDEQCTTYMFAAEVEAKTHDLPYKNLEFILYNALRKAYPKPPTITSRGDISVDRQKESTTIEMLMKALGDMGLTEIGPDGEPYYKHQPKLANYVEYVEERGYEQFIVRTPVFRNKAERVSCGKRVYMEALDMLVDPQIYPNPTGDYSCLRCSFRAPCIAADDGSDFNLMLSDMYESNWTR